MMRATCALLGAFVMVGGSTGCRSDGETKPEAASPEVADAKADDDPSAPSGEIPDDAGVVDVDAGAPPPPGADLGAVEAQLLDQLIVKVKPGAPERAKVDVAAFAAEVTGQELLEVRPGPLGIKLLVFRPTDPPRTEADRDRLKEALVASGAFEYVEANRLLHAREKPEGP